MPSPRLAIIGCGAAGAFCGALLREKAPDWDISFFEAGKRPLAKLALTGGGRCNLTNSFEGVSPSLREVYPRGYRLMKRALRSFGPEDTCRWFESHGVALTLQDDHRWFPASQDAMQIVHTLLDCLRGARIRTSCPVKAVLPGKRVVLADGSEELFDAILVTTGGVRDLSLLSALDLHTLPPVPSLFTFETDSPLRSLSGTSVPVSLALAGTSFKSSGSLLITDWGFSGPATLKLSSYAARHLAERSYRATLLVDWLGIGVNETRTFLEDCAKGQGAKLLASVHPVPSRLWQFLLDKAGFSRETRWKDLSDSALNRLTACLANDTYPITGKGRFKEEFVTCGGVALEEIDPATMESRKHPGLYFAGEVLDVDAVTGGFNLQAAWSTAFLCAEALGNLAK